MFKIDSNQNITINRGDNLSFPLFINVGNLLIPERYVFKENDGCEVYFYLLQPRSTFENAILKKTYRTDGTITTITNIGKIKEITTENNVNITEKGDIIISLEPDDTWIFPGGNYYYQIRAKLSNDNENNELIIYPGYIWFHVDENGHLILDIEKDDIINFFISNDNLLVTYPKETRTTFYREDGRLKDREPTLDSQYIMQTITNRLKFDILEDDYGHYKW